MLGLIVRRLIALVIVLFCVVTITFLLIRVAPGGPFDSERKIPEHIEKALLAKYQHDGPLHEQYFGYIGDLLRGDLRLSTKYRNRSVNEILAQTLPVSFSLGLFAFLLAMAGGILFGTFAAIHQNKPQDTGAMLAALLAISLPSFVTGPLLILVFALWLGWLPVGGWGTPSQLIMPVIVLAAPYMAYIARLMRSSMLDVFHQDFIRTARAKGVSERKVIYQHAMKVAILPVVSFAGPLAAHLLTGSIVIETIFNIPGAGGFFVNSILNRDGFLLGGVVIVYCTLLVTMNLIVDLVYGLLDKRMQVDG